MPVNASNLKWFPLFTPKFRTRVCWVILIILQLKRTAIDNASFDAINKIDAINRIDCINQYKYS